MPPKAKFSKEEIIEAALNIVRTEGFDTLTSRALGTKLGSSARPIFTVFQNMEEVQQSVMEAVKKVYKEYVQKGLSEKHPFKGVGTQYILFSVKEPKLFQLLFMTEHKQLPDLSDVLPLIDESYEQIIISIQNDYIRHQWLTNTPHLAWKLFCSYIGLIIPELPLYWLNQQECVFLFIFYIAKNPFIVAVLLQRNKIILI